MNVPNHILEKLPEEKQKQLSLISEFIKQDKRLSFSYKRADGKVSKHNQVHPRDIYVKNKTFYFKGYCYFTNDTRTFRLAGVKFLRPTRKNETSTAKDLIIVIIIILLGPVSFTAWTLSGGDPTGEWVIVTHVTDGDTIGVGRGWRYEKVRLIGVDTPETVHPGKPVEYFGPQASDFTESRLERQRVHLDFEPANLHDYYGRLLAYVYLEDGTNFNAELVKEGYARVSTYSRFRYYEECKQYEQNAKKDGLGIWSGKIERSD